MEDSTNGQVMRFSPPDIIVKCGAAVLVMLVLFLVASTFKTFREARYVGSGVAASNTISVTGMGEVFAVPDQATFSVTIREEGADVGAAQEKATAKSNAIIDYLKGEGVEEEDIKTISYNVNPKYEWEQQSACREGYCPPGRQKLTGFEVWQSLEVKVQDPKQAGDLLSGVGGLGASEVSSLSFTIEDEDELKSQAREEAIADAEAKADELASQLGVNIIRVVGFYEDSGGYTPYYGKGGAMMDMAVRSEAAVAPAPELPAGENKIVSNVNITYEIR